MPPDPEPTLRHAPDPEADAVLRLIRSCSTLTVLLPDAALPARFVTDHATGALVCPVDVALTGDDTDLTDLHDCTLWLPEESFDALQIHAAPRAIDPRTHPARDLHLAYHGPTPATLWAAFDIRSAKAQHPTLGALVADGAALMRPNPLARALGPLCKRLNADPARLADAVHARLAVRVEKPLAVGIDPFGVDVRARFGVLRLEADLGDTPDTAHAAIDRLLAPRE